MTTLEFQWADIWGSSKGSFRYLLFFHNTGSRLQYSRPHCLPNPDSGHPLKSFSFHSFTFLAATFAASKPAFTCEKICVSMHTKMPKDKQKVRM